MALLPLKVEVILDDFLHLKVETIWCHKFKVQPRWQIRWCKWGNKTEPITNRMMQRNDIHKGGQYSNTIKEICYEQNDAKWCTLHKF